MSEFIRDEQARRAQEEARRRDERRERESVIRPRETPERTQDRDELESMQRLADVVNDPLIEIDSEMVKAINDPEMVMMPTGEVAKVQRRFGSIGSQFRRDLILPRANVRKKRRKKNPKLAQAFKEANARYRTKSGKLRKGRTQADIARLAHRLMKKM